MVNHLDHLQPGNVGVFRRREQAFLMTEMLIALAILLGTLLPLAYSLISEKRMARAAYHRAVAMELVDGEMEILTAGEWHAMPPGTHEYQVHAASITNLPPGRFLLTIEAPTIRLEWQPAALNRGPRVVREVTMATPQTKPEGQADAR